MQELLICDECEDPKIPVTPQNGGPIGEQRGGVNVFLAYVHESCRDAWARRQGGAAFGSLTWSWPGIVREVRCPGCGKAFEVVGNQGSETDMQTETVRCPYDGCDAPSEITWPKGQPKFVRTIPSQM
jgi:DNA-directed RNA polymerase subunit RPC12/RpoP